MKIPLGACNIFWGSHGCQLRYAHAGAHVCCCDCVAHPDADSGCVGAAPYYGPDTRFYELAEAIGR
jgi:hypothetical protein